MVERYADVALGIPSSEPFQYAIPQTLLSSLAAGHRVHVRMRERKLIGTVVGFSRTRLFDELKPLEALAADYPVLDEAMLKLTRWMSEYYACSWGQVIDAALPASFRKGKMNMKARLLPHASTRLIAPDQEWPLTPSQQSAYEGLKQAIERPGSASLLHGITGSGKTEVYMHLIRDMLKAGRSSIVLVPEISLTPQAVHRFISRFGDCVAVIHSRLSQGKKTEEWHRIRNGLATVVVGARSAIFSPVRNLGLIVIDEEHETSYKQDEAPRYHAREVAKKRAEIECAALVLGSATPSIETFYGTTSGHIGRFALPKRIENRPLPAVQIVDMRHQQQGKKERIFSTSLEAAIKEVLHRKEQGMLLLNRRGFSTFLHCSSCGYVMTCPNCRISLTYHSDKAALMCHACHYQALTQRLCPGCDKHYLHYFGIGTQKVEMEAMKLFPGARIARMDTDSTSHKDAHERILHAFQKREYDLLIGTQMIAKGHDFPNVSLIGVISADTALHIPDFRSGERTFDLLTQVAGRAGRGEIPGKVIIQTFTPHHYAIVTAKDHDFGAFYKTEIEIRKQLQMPPFTHLIQIVIRGEDEKNVVRHILDLAKRLREKLPGTPHQLLGPAPCAVSKEHGQYHWNAYLKGPDISSLHDFLIEPLRSFKKKGVTLIVDVDPC